MTRRVAIIFMPDAFANAVKSKKIQIHLEQLGTEVTMIPTNHISRLGLTKLTRLLPGLGLKKLALYLMECILVASGKSPKHIKKYLQSIAYPKIMSLRGQLVSDLLNNKSPGFDLVVCESNLDQCFVLSKKLAKIQLLDLPSPFAEELFVGHEISQKAYNEIKKLEQDCYAAADALSFHWHTYQDYVKRTKYDGQNFISFHYGTSKKSHLTKFSPKPRIIFLGYLAGYWVNIELLAELCRQCPEIDVYGGPAPDPASGVNYKGYAPTTDVIKDYQFGLITISEDEVRKNSFSSKQLEYYSYGLPVLTPEWRPDTKLDGGAIYFNANNFLSRLDEFSSEEAWKKKSQAALKLAEIYDWKNVLTVLDELMSTKSVN